jgi:hypothetical protein
MAPRQKAGPRVPVPAKLGPPPPLTRRQRTALLQAIDVGDHIDLAGFERAIWKVLARLAATSTGPTAREVAAEIEMFVADHLVPLARAYEALSPAARDKITAPDKALNLEMALAEALSTLRGLGDEIKDGAYDDRAIAIDAFLGEIVELTEAAGADSALPSRASKHARSFPIFMTVITALDIALDLAEEHAPAAVPDLARLRECRDATLLNRLYVCRAKRREMRKTGAPVLAF